MKDNINSGFRIADLIVKRLEGKLTPEEEIYLNEWKHASEENLVLFHRLSQNPEKNYFSREAKLENLKKKDGWKNIQSTIKKDKTKKLQTVFLKVAAAIVIVIGGSFFFSNVNEVSTTKPQLAIAPSSKQALLVTGNGEKYQLSEHVEIKEKGVQISNKEEKLVYKKAKGKNQQSTQTFNTIIIPKGGEYQLTLMDGTHIQMNSNSKLRYPTQFGEGVRKVYLEGEAFFDVAKDPDHPFIVDVNDMQVKVLGTAFNVNAYTKSNDIITTLVEGKVEVRNEFFEKNDQLLPNEQFTFNKSNGKTVKKIVDTDVFTAWTRGRFVFENENLEEIMLRLERLYDIEVFFLNNAKRKLIFTGDLARYENIEEILEMLEVTQKVKFTIKDRSLMIE
jgi:ferric-dicitrate binding protein FerR (iron transport regulator)